MSDEELLTHLAAGGPRQRSALERLYRGKGREFGRFFVSQGLNRQDADDVLQEIILTILRHASDFRGRGTANAWMWQIARNALNDYHRRQAGSQRVMQELKVRAEIESESGQGSSRKPGLDDIPRKQAEIEVPATGLDPARLAEDCVTKGIARFATEEPERAYAIELEVEGLDKKEIADRIGRTYGATREYISQCRKRLAPFIVHCLPMLQD